MGGGIQSVKFSVDSNFGMLWLTNWFVGDMNVMKYVSLKLKVLNITYPDFQNMNNFLYLNFFKTSGKF